MDPTRASCSCSAPSTGTYLADILGHDYLAVGITAVTGVTAEADLDPTSRHGIRITSRPLDEPIPDSLEHSLTNLTRTELIDLRPARTAGTHAPSTIRQVTNYAATDLTAAFDVIICCPTMGPDRLAV
jgi:erythromycin esterase